MMPNSKDRNGTTRFTVRPVEPSPPGVRIHRLRGPFRDNSRAYEFLKHFRDDLEGSEDAVILDLSEIVHITSGGVGMLAALYIAARDAGRSLVLAQPGPQLSAILRVSGLLPIIPAYDSIEEAVRAIDGFAIAPYEIRTGTD